MVDVRIISLVGAELGGDALVNSLVLNRLSILRLACVVVVHLAAQDLTILLGQLVVGVLFRFNGRDRWHEHSVCVRLTRSVAMLHEIVPLKHPGKADRAV